MLLWSEKQLVQRFASRPPPCPRLGIDRITMVESFVCLVLITRLDHTTLTEQFHLLSSALLEKHRWSRSVVRMMAQLP